MVNGEVKHDMFPDWSDKMSGYRVDSRQLYIKNDLRQPREATIHSQNRSSEGCITAQSVPRDSQIFMPQVQDNPPNRQQSREETCEKYAVTPRNVPVVNEPSSRSTTSCTTSSNSSTITSGANSESVATVENEHIMDISNDPGGDPGGVSEQSAG